MRRNPNTRRLVPQGDLRALRPRAGPPVRPGGPPVHLVPDRGPVQRELHRGRLPAAATRSNDDPIPPPLSLYVHVPFCASPCFYCGCTKIITRDATAGARYSPISPRGRAPGRPVRPRPHRRPAPSWRRHPDLPLAGAADRTGRDPASQFLAARRRGTRVLDRDRSAHLDRRDARHARQPRLQPRQPRGAGLRPHRAEGGQPHPAARGRARGDRRRPSLRLQLGGA